MPGFSLTIVMLVIGNDGGFISAFSWLLLKVTVCATPSAYTVMNCKFDLAEITYINGFVVLCEATQVVKK